MFFCGVYYTPKHFGAHFLENVFLMTNYYSSPSQNWVFIHNLYTAVKKLVVIIEAIPNKTDRTRRKISETILP